MTEEMQELEMLRQEKHQRTQQMRAQAALQAAGVPETFAALLCGSSDEDTDQRTEQFCAAYQTALAEDVRKRLPQHPPAAATPQTAVRRSRGVHRVLR